MNPDGAPAAQPGSFAHLSDAQRLDWLQLIRSENIGPRTFRALINHFGGAGAALAGLPDFAAQKTGRRIKIAPRDACEQEMAQILKAGAQLVALGEASYPALLRSIDSPPPLVCVRGQLQLLQKPGVAIVGSRNASASGLSFADTLARELGAAGHVVVSGLARGIDARAHRASLSTGTIAVLAGGFDRIYPSDHIALADEIAESGVLLSEMPFTWEPRGRDFPRRNRIVAGLSLGTVVVEAARRSGSLITARFALEQGREVFAVPGSPLDPRAEGTNDLLRQGATFCTGADDVISALKPLIGTARDDGPLFREAGDWPGDEEPLWDEADLFGLASVPLTSRGQEFDEDGQTFKGESSRFVLGVDFAATGPPPRDGPSRPPPLVPTFEEMRALVVDLLGPSPVPLDDLVRASGGPAAQVRAVLMELELTGRLERHGGNLISLRPN